MKELILLIIAHRGFQPVEYQDTRVVLEKAGYTVVVASDKSGNTIDSLGNPGPAVTLTVDQVKVADYRGIFIIGGGGALGSLDIPAVHNLMKSARDAGIAWGAICISPRILCNAGLLDDKKFTGWDGDGKLKSHAHKTCPRAQVSDEPVVVDGKLVTARGPAASRSFGEAIVKVLAQKS